MTLSSMRMAVRMALRRRSTSRAPLWMCCGRFTEPRLQTAISLPAEVLRVISVQRFEECTTPTCCCGLRILQGSLKQNQGWPVSKSTVSILRQSATAETVLALVILPFLNASSYATYALSKAWPYRLCRSGTSSGEKRVHSAFRSTLLTKRSGIQLAVFMSWVRRRSSPEFLRDRKSTRSEEHTSELQSR